MAGLSIEQRIPERYPKEGKCILCGSEEIEFSPAEIDETGLKKDDINLFLDSCKKLNYFITGVNFTNKKIDLGEGIKPLELGRQYEIGHAIYKNIIEYVYGTSFRKGAFSDFFDKYIKPTISEYIRTYSTEAELENNLKIAKTIFTN